MHTLKLFRMPSALHRINYNMADHAEFVVTSDQNSPYNDLGTCIIGTRAPYFVAKIHAYRTQDGREKVAQRDEEERCEWLESLERREQIAIAAQKAGVSVRDYIERTGGKYDEEKDELRMVAKVPGLNVYLELYGCMDEEDTDMERWWKEENGHQPTDRMIDSAARTALNRMAHFYRATTTKARQRDLATQLEDWQPRDDWREQYDPDEFYPRPERNGIGYDHTDPTRRPTPFVRHKFSPEEQAEYDRLKAEAYRNGDLNPDLAALQQTAAANIAAQKMLEE